MAETISLISLAFALAMSACLAVLVFRRWRSERALAARERAERIVTRAYLTRVRTPDAADDALGISDAQVRLESVSHLLQLLRGADRNRLLDLADHDGLFDSALKQAGSRNAARRSDSIRILEQFGSERCVRSLLSLMANDSRIEIRIEAAGALARLGRLPHVRDTISLLSIDRARPNRMHQAIFRALAPRDIAQIRALLGEAVPDTLRALLVDAIGWSGDLRAGSELAAASLHASEPVRIAALRAARQLGYPRVADWVTALLDDPAEAVRAQAAQTCAKLAIRSAAARLEALRADTSWWVRMRAEEALATFAPPKTERDA